MIHTDGTLTIANRTEPIDGERKKALRLRKLAPLTYRRAKRAGRVIDLEAAKEHAPLADEVEVEVEVEPPTCPACWAGEGVLLGTLGRREHFRCRDCGMGFSRTIETLWPAIPTRCERHDKLGCERCEEVSS